MILALVFNITLNNKYMSLMRRSEWPSLLNGSLLSDFFDNEGFFTSSLYRQSVPAVNVKENEKNFEIELAAPGLSKKDFKVVAENGVLTISSEKKSEEEKKEKGYTRREFSYSSFSRSFVLPENTNQDDVKASYEDGVLRVMVAKTAIAQAKPQKAIEIK
jgi:HSP20 family protein